MYPVMKHSKYTMRHNVNETKIANTVTVSVKKNTQKNKSNAATALL